MNKSHFIMCHPLALPTTLPHTPTDTYVIAANHNWVTEFDVTKLFRLKKSFLQLGYCKKTKRKKIQAVHNSSVVRQLLMTI